MAAGNTDRTVGTAKEQAGRVLGDKEMVDKGRAQRAKGAVKNAGSAAKKAAQDVKEAATGG